jgi:hypothetical protein
MARFKGLIQFIGTLGGFTAVNSREGIYLKSKNSIPKSRYEKAPEYAALRMNSHYMAESSKLSKEFRLVFVVFGRDACDTRMYSRMNGLMRSIIMCDTVSKKGEFKAEIGMATDEGKKLLKQFEFNKFVTFNSVFHGTYDLNALAGVLSLPQFEPRKQLQIPVGASHVGLQNGILRFDFDLKKGVFTHSDPTLLPVAALITDVVLTAAIPEGSTGTLVYFLKISFLQEQNGVFYALKGNEGSIMAVVGVQ